MSKTWSQAFTDHPVVDLQANDLVAVSVSDGSGGYLSQDNAGKWGVISNRFTAIYVNETGSDTTGNGSLMCPFQSIQGAMTAITDATIDKQYVVYASGIITDASCALKPFIHVVSDGSPWAVSAISLDPSMNGAVNYLNKYQNLCFAVDATIDLTFSNNNNSGILNFINCTYASNSNRGINGPAVDFIFNTPSSQQKYLFNNCNLSGFTNNTLITFSAPTDIGQGVAVNLTFEGGCLPHSTIDFSNIDLPSTLDFINTTIGPSSFIEINSATVQFSGIQSLTTPVSITIGSNCTVSYDPSVLSSSNFTISGSGNTFIPSVDTTVIKGLYSPVNYTVPNPGIFQNTATVYDHLNGIDNALGSVVPSHGWDPNYISGLRFTWALGGGPPATIIIGTGQCIDSTGDHQIILSSPFTLTTSDIDTGTFANDNLYGVWLFGDTTNVNSPTVRFSLSFSSPTVPSGYNIQRYIGYARSNTVGGVTIIPFSQTGQYNERTYYFTGNDVFRTLAGGINNVQASPFIASCSGAGSPFCQSGVANSQFTPLLAGHNFYISPTYGPGTPYLAISGDVSTQVELSLVPFALDSSLEFATYVDAAGDALTLTLVSLTEYL